MIELRTLGSISLTGPDPDATESVLSQPKRVALLTFLALYNEGGFVRRDRLCEVFWPEADEAHARNSLNQALHHLRGALGDDVIESRGRHELRLSHERFWCDARSFRERGSDTGASDRLDLYRGDFLDGFHLTGAPAFERWADDQRRALKRVFLDSAESCVQIALANGDEGESVRVARLAVGAAPLDEAAAQRLVVLLRRLGRPADAIEAYDAYAARLKGELGLEPSPEMRALAQSLGSAFGDADPTPRGRASHLTARGHPDGPRSAALRSTAATPARRRRPTLRQAALILVAISVATAVLTLASRAGDREVAAPAGLVLVQPFENRTGDPELDFVGAAAANAIALGINARTAGLSGIVTSSPESFDTPEALFVTGWYDVRGDSVALSARVATSSGAPLRIEGPLPGSTADASAALAELQDRLTVVAAQHFGSGVPLEASAPIPKWEAFRARRQGRVHGARGEWTLAIPYLERAVEIDPGFASAYRELATLYGNVGNFRASDSILQLVEAQQHRLNPLERIEFAWNLAAQRNDRQERLRLVRARIALLGQPADLQLAHELIGLNRPAEALEALALLDEDAMFKNGVERLWTHQARAHHLIGDHDAELDATRRGSQKFPNHLAVIRYEASALGALGRVEELEALVERAFSAPVHGGCCPSRVPLNGGLELLAHGHPDAGRRILALGADLHARRSHETERERERHAEILLAAERWREARALFASLKAQRPDKVSYWGSLGVIAARTGDRAAALRILGELDPERFYSMDKPVAMLFRARISAALGDLDEAMHLLRDATAGGLAVEAALHQPEFVELRKTGAFKRWAEPVG